MFSDFSICYLFCGGVGSGALLAGSLVDIVRAVRWRRSGGVLAEQEPARCDAGDALARACAQTFLVGFGLVVFGIVCLWADLGFSDRALLLFALPTRSLLTLGSFLLVFIVAAGIVPVLAGFFALGLPRRLVLAFEGLTALAALPTMTYTGLLLFDISAVDFWTTPLVPLLFVLSSLSGGSAVLALSAYFAGADEGAERLSDAFMFVDGGLVALEIVAAALFAFLSLTGESETTRASARAAFAFADERLSMVWLFCYFGCGLVLPGIVLARAIRRRASAHPLAPSAFALVAVLVLVGSAGLRYGMVEAGQKAELAIGATTAPLIETYDWHDGAPIRLEE